MFDGLIIVSCCTMSMLMIYLFVSFIDKVVDIENKVSKINLDKFNEKNH